MDVLPETVFPLRSYFFDAGIRFQCRQCGACCTGAPGTIYVAASEIDAIAAAAGLERSVFIQSCLYPYKDSYSIREDEQGCCLFFDKGCSIYAARPLQCRTFPFWLANIRNEKQWRDIERDCPGIGNGRLFSKAEILAVAWQTAHI